MIHPFPEFFKHIPRKIIHFYILITYPIAFPGTDTRDYTNRSAGELWFVLTQCAGRTGATDARKGADKCSQMSRHHMIISDLKVSSGL